MPKSRVLVTITIDTECDHDLTWTRSNPITFESINVGIPDRLQPAFQSVGAAPTYLLTVEVMENNECLKTLNALNGNFELGTHLHSAFIEPEKKFFDYAGIDSPDFQTHCRPDVEYKKLENLTNLFKANFNRQPKSFRAGRYGAGTNTILSLKKLGYTSDTSVTPHIKWPHPDGPVDYRGCSEQAYFPSLADFKKPGAKSELGGFVEIPVTMKKRLFRGPKWFRPFLSDPKTMKAILSDQVRKFSNRPVVILNMMFHSMEVIAKASPYTKTELDVQRYLSDMTHILGWCTEQGFEHVTTAQAAEIFCQAAD